MIFLIKLHPEITTKSDSVRKRFIKILSSNIRNIMLNQQLDVAVIRTWDFIEVRAKQEKQQHKVLEILQNTSGIQQIMQINESTFSDINDIFHQVLATYRDKLVGQKFVVRCKRKGKHSFNSLDVERYVGGGLKQHVPGTSVNLKHPQQIIKFEIIDNKLKLIINSYQGLGGFPLGTQGDVLSMISGGYDSAVSSFNLIRRGCRVHYLFFNLGGRLHLQGVKHIVNHLWTNYSSSHKVRFITIDFQPIVAQILEKVNHGMMGVILKRLFYYVADQIAQRYNIDAIVTGEAIGQVSSQTLFNLNQINQASKTMVIRPLISMDKEQIINQARVIGTAQISQTIPEFCGVISNKPTIKALGEQIAAEEAKLDITSLVAQAIQTATNQNVRELFVDNDDFFNLQIVTKLEADDLIIDIRDSIAVENTPLEIDTIQVIHVPFYKIQSEFDKLDSNKRYLLYCEHGVLSKIQANILQHQGFTNVAVLSPQFNK